MLASTSWWEGNFNDITGKFEAWRPARTLVDAPMEPGNASVTAEKKGALQ